MSITSDFDILFLVCKGYLVIRASRFGQAAFKTTMNTKFDMILETFTSSFEMAQEIPKDYKVFILRLRVFLGSFAKKKNNNTK